jgi:CRP-like cAMP-binding protein
MPVNASDLADTQFRVVLDDEQLATLAERFAPRTYGVGAIIIRAGQPVQHVHVVRRGRVLLYTENEMGERISIRECPPGEQFGEMQLLDETPSPYSALALEETVLLHLDRPDFEALLASNPQFGRELLRSLSWRLREMFEAFRAQSISDVDRRWSQSESGAMKLARWVATLAGSWVFFVVFAAFLSMWMVLGKGISWPIYIPPFDPYPYILLNLVLTTMAAVNAPIILVVVNGLNQKNRQKEKVDFENHTRMLVQIARLHAKLDQQNRWIENQLDLERVARLESEMASLRSTLDEERSAIVGRLDMLSPKASAPGDQRVPAAN